MRVLLGETLVDLKEKSIFSVERNNVQSTSPIIDLEQKDENGNTALALAAKHGNLDMVVLLLKKGANPNVQNRFGESPVMMAVMGHNIEVLKPLSIYGADFNLKNNAGELPLHHSLEKGASLNMLEALLACNADPNLKDDSGDSALMIAVRKKFGALGATKLLLDPQYRVNINDNHQKFKTTALFDAVNAENTSVVKFLLEKGADPMAKDAFGTIPRYFLGATDSSSGKKYQEMEKMLRDAEALKKA